MNPEYLNIAEVEVFAPQSNSNVNLYSLNDTNYIKFDLKDASQSNTYPPHDGLDCCTAEKALDGNPDSFTITHSTDTG